MSESKSKHSGVPPQRASHGQAIVAFCVLSVATFVLIYLTPPSTQILFPAFEHVRKTGTYPDGLTIRRTYTGVRVLDEIFTGLAGFFSAAVDGQDEATRMFCLWFLPQLLPVLAFLYWEATRTTEGLVSRPTLFGMLAQLITAGVVLPLYFAAHIHRLPINPMTSAKDSRRAWGLLPAIALGFLLPTAFLFLFPASNRISLDTKQIIAAVWQPFPIYVALAYCALCNYALPSQFENDSQSSVHAHLKCTYMLSGLVSLVAHWAILIPSFFASDPRYSFYQIFIPYPLHTTLGVPPDSLHSYRLSIRLLFQNDWLTTTVAAYFFFGYVHSQLSRTTAGGPRASMWGWARCMLAWTIAGGPGAAIAWAAVNREEGIRTVLENMQETFAGGSTAIGDEKSVSRQ